MITVLICSGLKQSILSILDFLVQNQTIQGVSEEDDKRSHKNKDDRVACGNVHTDYFHGHK